MCAQRIIGDDRARLLSRLDRSGGPESCWPFQGAKTDQGYGNFWLSGKYMGLHRAAYRLFIGEIPKDLDVDHECHNLDKECPGGTTCPHRMCGNFERHLFLNTRRTNLFRGRASSGVNAAKTHCPRLHLYSEENTYVTKDGRRTCRQCHREREAARRQGFDWPPHWPVRT